MVDKERIAFVVYWAEYCKTHPKEAGKEYVRFINAMMQNAKNYPFSPKQYLKMKGESCER